MKSLPVEVFIATQPEQDNTDEYNDETEEVTAAAKAKGMLHIYFVIVL